MKKCNQNTSRRGYTRVINEIARNKSLSYRSRGVFILIASFARGFQISSDRLSKFGTEGRDAIRKSLKELEDVGYLQRRRVQCANGHWITILTLSESVTALLADFQASDCEKNTTTDDGLSVVNNNNKRILAISSQPLGSSSPNKAALAGKQFSMFEEWKPEPLDDFKSISHLMGVINISDMAISVATAEFIDHWCKPENCNEKRTNNEWLHALARSMKRQEAFSCRDSAGIKNKSSLDYQKQMAELYASIDQQDFEPTVEREVSSEYVKITR